MIPPKLKPEDEIRIVAPARSLSLLSEEGIKFARENLEKQGFKVTFSQHCKESDDFISSSIKSRVEDIHDAFRDKSVKAILTVIGGFNSNQLLKYLDYDLIKNNPKILCGFSDITALTNAITAKTGLVTYSGLHFATWGMQKEFKYNLEYFKKCLVEDTPFTVEPAKTWSEDEWYLDQENRTIKPNDGHWILNTGEATGTLIGGNLCTFNLLHGTEYMPDLTNKILFLEDCLEGNAEFVPNFDRDLQSIIHQPGFETVKGIVLGRCEESSGMTQEKLKAIIASKKELANMPVIANVDFGHTNPMITFPIGGTVELKVDDKVKLRILEH